MAAESLAEPREEAAEPACPTLRERGRGLVCGALVGDALGAPFEGESSASIARVCDSLGIAHTGPSEMVDGRRFPDALASAEAMGIDLMVEKPDTVGWYTDDTEMLMALAESLTTVGYLEPEHVALSSALWFVREPDRGGYSAHTFEKMCSLATGSVSFRTSGSMHDEWLRSNGGAGSAGAETSAAASRGSFGNGGAMRIAPVGFAYRHLADDPGAMRRLVAQAIGFTHTHAEAIDAATVLALAVARTATAHASAHSGAAAFLAGLRDATFTDELRARLSGCVEALDADKAGAIVPAEGDSAAFTASDKALLSGLCTPGKWFQIRAVDAVTYVLYFVAKYGALGSSGTAAGRAAAESALVRVVAIGGDCDTLACMAGAVLGAAHGDGWIPERWSDATEQNETYGWPRAQQLGDQLAALRVTDSRELGSATDLIAALKAQLSAMPIPTRHPGVL